MRIIKTGIGALIMCFIISGCYLSAKMDRYVSGQYGDQLPKANKQKKADIVVNSSLPPLRNNDISFTKKKTSQLIPLIIYWSYDYRRTCTLNPQIPVVNLSNTINANAGKGLSQKLDGKRLELTVEQIPDHFAIVDKAHILLVFTWDKLYVEPDFRDMIVSYQLKDKDATSKTGTITVKNPIKNQGIRFFQSWKSSISEQLFSYNANITSMAKDLIEQLEKEL